MQKAVKIFNAFFIVLVIFTSVVTGIFQIAACGAAQDCAKPENMGSLKCAAVNSTIDCTKNELPAVVTQFGPVVGKLIGEATGADGSVDWAHVESMLGSLGSAYGACVIGTIIESYALAPPKLATGEVRPSLEALKEGLNHSRVTLWKLDGGVKIHTAHGDI